MGVIKKERTIVYRKRYLLVNHGYTKIRGRYGAKRPKNLKPNSSILNNSTTMDLANINLGLLDEESVKRGRGLNETKAKKEDSHVWRNLLAYRDMYWKFLICNVNYNISWISGNEVSHCLVFEEIRTRALKDKLAKGIWAYKCTKMSTSL